MRRIVMWRIQSEGQELSVACVQDSAKGELLPNRLPDLDAARSVCYQRAVRMYHDELSPTQHLALAKEIMCGEPIILSESTQPDIPGFSGSYAVDYGVL